MADEKPNPDKKSETQTDANEKKKEPTHDAQGRVTKTKLTKRDVAHMVRRMVPKRNKDGQIEKDKHGNPVAVAERIGVDDVMSFAEYDDKVVVVTKAGEKLEAAKE